MSKFTSWCLAILGISCTTILAQDQAVYNTIRIDRDDSQEAIIRKAAQVVPTWNQYQALRDEFIAFIHFGPNTFTRKEWGDGMEDPSIFNLQNLDTDQWCKAIRNAGMKKVILTAKHHDGFVLWQSRYTNHGVMSSPFKDGKGDILTELAQSCKKYGLKLGIYLSPADLYQIEHPDGLYGNLSQYTERTIPRPVPGRPFKNTTTFSFNVDDYNEYFLNQLFEVLTEYGPIHEVWFDGAHPKRKGGQTYHYHAWKELIRTLVPEAVIFGREDIRWCGNESGATRQTEWNIIPYPEDPHQMNHFSDLTNQVLGERSNLVEGNYLHYQPAETNTSIRAGWFYRDDTHQNVRNADDVFDMYERSVGGNSVFLLNIPPNREGRFSSTDVAVLEEVGRRIRNTYGDDLLLKANGPKELLDDDGQSYLLLDSEKSFEILTDVPILINRLVIQEAILTHSERVEHFKLEAWIDNAWKEVIASTNIGYKRILRFPQIETNKIKVTILKQRNHPAISKVSAHYYKPVPPQLTIVRNKEGMVEIRPKQNAFSWKPHRENYMQNINLGYDIRYSTDGTQPNTSSSLFDQPFKLSKGTVHAVAVVGDAVGSIAERDFGYIPYSWNSEASSANGEHAAALSYDCDPLTYWQTEEDPLESHYLQIDLGKILMVSGIFMTPPQASREGMIEKGVISFSTDGKSWSEAGEFEFGNLLNDPSRRSYFLEHPVQGRYLRLKPLGIAGNSKVMAIAELEIF